MPLSLTERKILFNTLVLLEDLKSRGCDSEQLEVAVDCISNACNMQLSSQTQGQELKVDNFVKVVEAALNTAAEGNKSGNASANENHPDETSSIESKNLNNILASTISHSMHLVIILNLGLIL